MRDDQSVRCLLGLGPLLRVGWRWGHALLLSCREGRESLAQGSRGLQSRRCARIARSDRRRRGLPGSPGRAPDRPGRRPSRRSPCGAPRPSWTALVGQRLDGDPPARQVPPRRPRPGPGRRQPDADRSIPAGRPGGQAPDEDGRRPGLRTADGRAAEGRRGVDPGRGPGCRPTSDGPRFATATRPRWARSTSCRLASTGPIPGSTRSSARTPTTPT